jgi:succinate-acetate transporter protein
MTDDIEKQQVEENSDSSLYMRTNSGSKIARVTTSGDDDEILHIGDTKVFKRELIAAFGGDLNPGLHAPPSRKFGNPSPLGLCGFALTTFVLSLVNIRARGVANASGVIGLAYFYGGLIQLLAGMWEIVVENPFGATALSSYGGFWLSWAALETKSFGIAEAYADPADMNNVVGFFLLGWFFFTFIMLLCTLRSTVAFFGLFFSLDVTFLFLTINHLGNSPVCGKIGGYFGLITAAVAWYNAYAGLATKENSYFVVKPIFMPGAAHA